MSIAKNSLRFCSMFEGELLAELMLRYWKHPLAEDSAFRSGLIEDAAKALRLSIKGNVLIEDLPSEYMSFIAALWYVEWSYLQNAFENEISETELEQREAWLNALRHAVPSCFCNPNDLP